MLRVSSSRPRRVRPLDVLRENLVDRRELFVDIATVAEVEIIDGISDGIRDVMRGIWRGPRIDEMDIPQIDQRDVACTRPDVGIRRIQRVAEGVQRAAEGRHRLVVLAGVGVVVDYAVDAEDVARGGVVEGVGGCWGVADGRGSEMEGCWR